MYQIDSDMNSDVSQVKHLGQNRSRWLDHQLLAGLEAALSDVLTTPMAMPLESLKIHGLHGVFLKRESPWTYGYNDIL